MPMNRVPDPEPDFNSDGWHEDEFGSSKQPYCEDFPCCGHEAGDCNGNLYGSDESIKQRVYDRMGEDFDCLDDPEGCY